MKYIASLNSKVLFFYFTVSLGLIAILFSHPFLRYPYDMIHHLIVIDDLYIKLVHPIQELTGIWINDTYIIIPTGEVEPLTLASPRYIWHYIWAVVFDWFDIDSTQMFLRAKIIHVVQTMISFASIYYFSNVILRNVFKEISASQLQWLSLWSVLIWLTIFATSSAYYHQIWMMWYSVNYQITLPLFWYMTALTLVLLLEETSIWGKTFFTLQIIILSRFILQAHSMEFIYYLMYIVIFGLIYIDKTYIFVKKYFYLFIPIIGGIGYFIKNYQPEHSKIFEYLNWDKLPQLYEKIMEEGALLVEGYNRASSSVNELMYFLGIISILFILYICFQYYYKKQKNINLRMLLFVGLTSLFVLIPLYQFSGGVFGLLTNTSVVNRLYYSSSLFILLPIIIYYFSYHFKIKHVQLFLIVSLLSMYIFSKHNAILNHNYYKNIQSIKHSFNEKRVGFNLTKEQIAEIGQRLLYHEKNNHLEKKEMYYARADIAFVIKYIYKRDVYWEGRRANPDYIKIYEKNKKSKDYVQVLFNTPKGFPLYRPYM